MKKTLLLFAMLLSVVGAWAEVTLPTVSTDLEKHYYLIKALRGNKYASFAGNHNQLKQVAEADVYSLWYFKDAGTEGDGTQKYKLYNAATDQVYAGVSNFNTSGAVVYVKENPHREGYVCISLKKDLSGNCWDANNNGQTIGNYAPTSNDNQGTSWSLIEVDNNDVVIGKLSYHFEDNYKFTYDGSYNAVKYNKGVSLPTWTLESCYTFSNIECTENTVSADLVISFPFPLSNWSETEKVMISTYGGEIFKYYQKDSKIKVDKELNPSNETIRNFMWEIFLNPVEGKPCLSIKNAETGKYIYTTATNGSHGESVLSLSDVDKTYFMFTENSFKIHDKSLYLSVNSSNTADEQPVGLHGNSHNGSRITTISCKLSYTLTDNVGNTYTGEYDGWSQLQPDPTFTGVSYTLSNQVWNGNQLTADIEFNNLPFPVSSAEKINPTMISSFGGNVNKWYATEAAITEPSASDPLLTIAKKVTAIGTKKNVDPTDANKMSYMWAIYPVLDDVNAFKFKVQNLATGAYVHSTSNKDTHNAGAVTLETEGSMFTFESSKFKLSTEKYLSLNSSTATGLQFVGTWSSHGGCNLSFLAIEDVNLEQVRFAIKSEIDGYENENPNTHLGTISVVNGTYGYPWNLSTSSVNAADVRTLFQDKSQNVSLALTRKYRGFDFLGFRLGDKELGQTPTLTAEQVNAISEANPIIAQYQVIPGEVTLFYDDDAFSYRIPAIGKTSTGRLIAVSDYRYSLDDIGRYNFGDANPGIDLVMRYSDDNGKTWSETKTIAKCSGKRGTNDCAYGDAAIAVVGQKVLVMGAAGDVVFNGGTATNHNRTVRIFSEDNGQTWTAPQDISETLFIGDDATIKNGYTAFFGSGKLAVDENYNGTGKARIYGAMLIKKEGYGNAIYVIYTDDFGVNWNILGGSQNPVTTNDEPKVEILPSGQILLSVRRGGGRQFNVFTYTDKATNAGSWDSNVDGCSNGGSNTCNGEPFVIDAVNAQGNAVKLLLQSQPKGGSGLYDRRDVTIWYKEVTDANYTSAQIAADWTQGLQVSTQQSAYSAMALQDDGKIAFFFEEAPCYGDDQAKGYCMVYVPLTIEKITKGNYADKNAQAKTVTVTVTDTFDNTTYNESLNIFVSDEEAIKNLVKSTWAFADFGDDPTVVTDGTSITYTNTVTLPFKVSNNENTYWHNIYFPSNGNGATEKYPVYMSSDETTTLKISTEKLHYGYSSLNTKDNADKISWAIYQKGNGFTFKFKNKLKDQYIKTEGDAVAGKAQNVKYTENAEEATAFDIVDGRTNSYVGEFGISTNGGQLIVYGVGDGYVSYSTAIAHQGAWVKFVEAPDFDWHIEAVNRELRAIGTAVGLYATDDDVEAARTAMTSANTVKWNTLEEYYKNIRRDGREVNAPSVGMYRIKNNNTGAYIHGNANGTISLASEFDNYTSIFYLNENNQLISYRMGRHLDGQAKNLAEVNTACDVEFNVAYGGVTEGVLTIKSNGAWIGHTIYQPTIESSTVGTQSAAYDWTFEKVEWLPVPVNTSVGYATLYSPVALNTLAPNTQNHRVEAYIGTIKGDRFSMEQVDAKDGIIPANTPVILVYKQDAEYGLVYLQVVNSNEEAPAENELCGTFESSYIEDDAYVLSAPEGKLGLYMADKNFYENNGTWTKDTTIGTHFLNNGFKAYLPAPAGADARFFLFDFSGEETGITETENGNVETENSEVYDLAGRRVQNAKKGIFVINGKVVVK